VAKVCPFCKGGNNGDADTFAIGLHNGAYSCLRGGCNQQGSFRQLCEFFGEQYSEGVAVPKAIGSQQKKTYVRPNPDMLKPLTEEIITYFAIRKISEETLTECKVSSDEVGNIIFPFYRNNELIFVKKRKPYKVSKEEGPKEWQQSGTEPILWGMDNVAFNKPLIITEGMIDALSLYEAGCHNVVSVPSGVNNLDWITLCWDWLENFSQIILFGDNDQPGLDMISTLMKRLGEDRCLIPQEYPQLIMDGKDMNRLCKDANEILYCYGPEVLHDLVKACEPAPVKGILNLAHVPFVDPATIPRIFTRVPALDNAIGGLGEGSVTVFSGKRGEGKSTMNGQLLLNAIDQGYNVCAYSGELSAYKFLEWIMLQATEAKYVTCRTDGRSNKVYNIVPASIQERIKTWIDGHFYLFDNAYVDEVSQQEAILKVFTICARRYGCKLFLVDNLMVALTSADEENKAQAKFAAALKAFAVKYKVAVILVAHPRKTKQGENFTNDDVSGSSAITNLADTVISVEKPHLRITKNREFGTCEYITCTYSPVNRRIYQSSIGDKATYGWDHTGIELPEDQAINHPEFAEQGGEKQQPIPGMPF
jgi:twinkle protein